MNLDDLARVDLDCRDTPLQRLPRTSARLQREVWVKRDDRTGLGLSGNKVRKLEYLLAEAEAEGADVLLTCGGIQSNHCRATAVAARVRGLDVGLVLRGSPPLRRSEDGGLDGQLDGNLMLDAVLGARVRWVNRNGWDHRRQVMERWAEELRAEGRRPYLIPEGGSNATGSLGFVAAADELMAQLRERGIRATELVVATGSGGTLAGLAAGLARHTDAPELLAVAVCDDAAYFERIVALVGHTMSERHGIAMPPPGQGWRVVEGYKGVGYGQTTPQELGLQVRLAREEGLFLDPVYTGKAWVGLEHLVGRGELGHTVVFWHTGGLFGTFGRGLELARAMDVEDYVAS